MVIASSFEIMRDVGIVMVTIRISMQRKRKRATWAAAEESCAKQVREVQSMSRNRT